MEKGPLWEDPRPLKANTTYKIHNNKSKRMPNTYKTHSKRRNTNKYDIVYEFDSDLG
jgi:hypothetical protein